MKQTEKPKHLLVCKILGIIFAVVFVAGIVLTIKGFGEDSPLFMIGGFMTTFGMFLAVSCSVIGFGPELNKNRIKTVKYMQSQSQEDLKDIADTTAEINSDAITKTTQAVKKGLKDTKYCKYCGTEIDNDSVFCKECGKKQS